MNGVILYGAPATGKDTVTEALVRRYPAIFVPYKRLKCGPGRTAGYRMISPEAMAAIPASSILWTNRRYGATYLVDREGLAETWEAGRVPVLHLGQPEAVDALMDQTPDVRWLVVELHSPLEALRERIRDRGTGDDGQRIEAAMHTPRLLTACVRINTSVIESDSAARLIAEHMPRSEQDSPRKLVESAEGVVD
jgi:guanylate kinase